MSNDRKEEEMICALTADESAALHSGLQGLPETMPPRNVWRRIKEQAEAEGLLVEAAPKKYTQWYAGVGLAAAAVMAAVLMLGITQSPGTTVPDRPITNSVDLSDLAVLQAYSRRLESNLRALPAEPRVARAGTVATMSEIEDRIAAIDFQLNDTSAAMTDGDREIFWRERVRLMKLLLQLRYAQAQRAAF